ncbi:RNA polymerase sigma factor [Streptomyces otsuchiensis]|uniref:RNA polymerase sigma factor n=1 Tax=Streptomyces otsuchiensis TaxID=2681388 RepID=UPI0010310524|nr:sigma factor-like helix-turn-helix DNA-binding protein [Streptomyces otsuchiensis]
MSTATRSGEGSRPSASAPTEPRRARGARRAERKAERAASKATGKAEKAEKVRKAEKTATADLADKAEDAGRAKRAGKAKNAKKAEKPDKAGARKSTRTGRAVARAAAGAATEAEPAPAPATDASADTSERTAEADDLYGDDFPDDPEDPDAARTPVHAFDALYLRHAGPIGQQAYLLCGRRDTAAHAVAYGFRRAWEQWPEVAVDRDPAGWVRAAAYEYALSPWHCLRPWRRRPRATGGSRDDQALLDALLRLPANYRRALVLHDALGMGLAATAAESESTTGATAARIRRGRHALAEELPRLAAAPPEGRREVLGLMLEDLTESQPVRPLPASRARLVSERSSRRRVRASVLLVLSVTGTIALSVTGG